MNQTDLKEVENAIRSKGEQYPHLDRSSQFEQRPG